MKPTTTLTLAAIITSTIACAKKPKLDTNTPSEQYQHHSTETDINLPPTQVYQDSRILEETTIYIDPKQAITTEEEINYTPRSKDSSFFIGIEEKITNIFAPYKKQEKGLTGDYETPETSTSKKTKNSEETPTDHSNTYE